MIQESCADERKSLYLYTGEGSYEPLARIDRNGNQKQHIYYFHTDLNGMPEELTDEAGEIVWECLYQLWGKPIQEIIHREIQEIQQNLRYQEQYLDRKTRLHYNTFSYYDPDTGRFTQPDPIGLAGGFNLYQYAPNALMWIDPKGLKSCFTNAKAQSNAEKIIEKHGGIKTGENRYKMPNRRTARQAASELSGNLGSNPKVIHKSEFERGPYGWKKSNGKIGMQSADENAGWRDDVLGHPHLGAGPHVNVWNKSKGILDNLHLDY